MQKLCSQKIWVHPEYTLADRNGRRWRARCWTQNIFPFRLNSFGMTNFGLGQQMLGTSLLVIFTLMGLLIYRHSDSAVTMARLSALNQRYYGSIALSKNKHLNSLYNKKKDLSLAHVNFVSSLILRKNPGFPEAQKLSKVIVEKSIAAGYDPLFVTSIIFAESSFKTQAVSKAGARGLMQLMPATARYVSNKSNIPMHNLDALHNPDSNISLGLAYLQYLSKRYKGDLSKTLAAYNWGPANLDNSMDSFFGRIPGETKTYVHKIFANYGKWSDEFESYFEKQQVAYLQVSKASL